MRFKKSIFYIIPFLLILIPIELFVPYPESAPMTAYEEVLILYAKLLPFIALLYVILTIWKQKTYHRIIAIIPVIYFIYLLFESLFLYNSFFKYPHVGLKIMDLIIMGGLFFYYYKRPSINYTHLMNFIILALIMKILVDPRMISAAAFVEHKRGIPSDSAYLLLLPCLYFFNIYIVELKQVALIKFLFLLAFIIFIQHRTVWVATSVAFLFNIFLLTRQGKFQLGRAIPGFIPIAFTVLFVSSAILTYMPNIADKINENVNQILNPEKSGSTSEWRMEQFKSYMPFIADHPLEGMRFRGFELPIQFYNPETSEIHWAEGTGHHFHSFYFDKLFYFGLIGLLMFLYYMLRPISTILKNKLELDHREICFLSFVFSGIVYGLGYDLPTTYFGVLAIALAAIERERLMIRVKKAEDINL